MTEDDEKVELAEKSIETEMEDFQRLLKDENISEEEKMGKIEEHFKSFSGNFKIIVDDIEQTKNKLDKEIEKHETFIKNIVPLVQDPKIDELKKKENELIAILRKESSWLDKFYSFFKSIEYIISMNSEILSALEPKNKLQYEINIMVLDLREKGIIK